MDRFLVKVLFHEARRRQMPMTRLLDLLLRDTLRGSIGWHLAELELPDTPEPQADRKVA